MGDRGESGAEPLAAAAAAEEAEAEAAEEADEELDAEEEEEAEAEEPAEPDTCASAPVAACAMQCSTESKVELHNSVVAFSLVVNAASLAPTCSLTSLRQANRARMSSAPCSCTHSRLSTELSSAKPLAPA